MGSIYLYFNVNYINLKMYNENNIDESIELLSLDFYKDRETTHKNLVSVLSKCGNGPNHRHLLV